ncbi:MAG: CBS domain-containing protein [Caldilineaceae bacterium]
MLESVTVSEVMTRDVQTVHKDATLPELSDLFAATHSHGFPILNDDGSLWGIITVTDFDRAVMQEMPRRTTASEIGVPRDQLITATASETVGDVLARMGTRLRTHARGRRQGSQPASGHRQTARHHPRLQHCAGAPGGAATSGQAHAHPQHRRHRIHGDPAGRGRPRRGPHRAGSGAATAP